MSLELFASNAVVVAHQFNPTIMGQLWLVRNGVVAEDEFQEGSVFTDMFVHIKTESFEMTVVPHQCQFNPLVETDRQQELLLGKVGAIVRSLPHTPYRAVGLNFTWHYSPEGSEVATASRTLFGDDESLLYREFAEKDARFGAYMSKNFGDCRLTLDAKPIVAKKAESEAECIQFAFNCHREVVGCEAPAAAIEDMLRFWNEARQESKRIMQSVLQEETV